MVVVVQQKPEEKPKQQPIGMGFGSFKTRGHYEQCALIQGEVTYEFKSSQKIFGKERIAEFRGGSAPLDRNDGTRASRFEVKYENGKKSVFEVVSGPDNSPLRVVITELNGDVLKTPIVEELRAGQPLLRLPRDARDQLVNKAANAGSNSAVLRDNPKSASPVDDKPKIQPVAPVKNDSKVTAVKPPETKPVNHRESLDISIANPLQGGPLKLTFLKETRDGQVRLIDRDGKSYKIEAGKPIKFKAEGKEYVVGITTEGGYFATPLKQEKIEESKKAEGERGSFLGRIFRKAPGKVEGAVRTVTDAATGAVSAIVSPEKGLERAAKVVNGAIENLNKQLNLPEGQKLPSVPVAYKNATPQDRENLHAAMKFLFRTYVWAEGAAILDFSDMTKSGQTATSITVLSELAKSRKDKSVQLTAEDKQAIESMRKAETGQASGEAADAKPEKKGLNFYSQLQAERNNTSQSKK